MKGTEAFKEAIKSHLEQMARQDSAFAEKYIFAKEPKTLDNCVNYIIEQVKKSGCNGFDDDEIYGMAAHYYQEDDLGAVKPTSATVVVNHHIELTEAEKEAARQKAIEDYQAAELRRLQQQEKKAKEKAEKKAEKKRPAAVDDAEEELTLFDLI